MVAQAVGVGEAKRTNQSTTVITSHKVTDLYLHVTGMDKYEKYTNNTDFTKPIKSEVSVQVEPTSKLRTGTF